MPIFGLVWVASWVGCFFPSHQDFLKTPSYACMPAQSASGGGIEGKHVLPLQAALPFQSGKGSASDDVTTFAVSPARQTKGGSASSSNSGRLSSVPVLIPNAAVSTFLKSLLQSVGVPVTSSYGDLNKTASSKFKQSSTAENKQSSCSTKGFGDRLKSIPVKLKGRTIGHVNSQQQATQITQQLEQLLRLKQSSLTELKPALSNGLPVVKTGDRTLITIDLNSAVGCRSKHVARMWVNNLRTVLAEAPLSFVESQQKMLGLQETEQVIAGMASWYGPYFHGRQTATGEIFDQNDFTAAHPSLPFDTYLKVTNLLNGKSIIVRVNDRGPYVGDRELDLSYAAARYLGSEEEGVVPVEAVVMQSTANSGTQAIARL